MSLINEALKKAQKVRTGDSPTELPPMPGGEPFAGKRAQSRSTQTILMLAAGGAVLVAISVAITFWLVNRVPAEKSPAAPLAAKPVPAAAATPTPASAKATPATTMPTVASSPPPKTQSVASKPEPLALARAQPAGPIPPASQAGSVAGIPANAPAVPTAVPPAASAPLPTAPLPTATPEVAQAQAAPAAAPVSSPPPKGDALVHAFVDSIKVAGIRPSGSDSRVLMNDRVFRVNDIVERNLGVRLTKVEADALTFTDMNGAVYVKNF